MLSLGGSISGTVSDSTREGVNPNDVAVTAYTSQGIFVNSANTTSAGNYTMTGLPGGTYVLRTSNSAGYVDKLYHNKVCVGCSLSSGTPVSVTAGAPTNGIDFQLDKGGRISGTVRDGSGAGIAGITVGIYNSVNYFVTSAITDNLGQYITKTGLQAGTSYFARTSNSLGYVNVTYPTNTCLTCSVTVGTAIGVTAGQTTPNIDFTLALGGRITGIITDGGSGQPLQGISVTILLGSGQSVGGTSTNANGAYSSQGLPEGDYYAKTNNGSGYINQLYDARDCIGCAVAPAGPFTWRMAPRRQASISRSGKAAGSPGRSWTPETATRRSPAPRSRSTPPAGSRFPVAGTNAAGIYTTTAGLPTGTYYARTFNSQGYVNKLFDSFTCFQCTVSTGIPITVTSGATTSGINFSLTLGGRIAGTVISGARPVPDAFVDVFSSGGTFLTSAHTGTAGKYITGEGLPPGTYYVVTENGSGLHRSALQREAVQRVPISGGVSGSCAITSGTAVNVVGTATHAGVDFNLPAGLGISGTITDKVTGQPLTNAQVNIYNAAGAWVAYGFADGLGNWTSLSGLPANSTYFVKAGLPSPTNPYVSKLYNDITCPSCDPLTGTPVALTTSSVGNVNFALEKGSVIGGTVTDTNAQPISGAIVRVFDARANWPRPAAPTTPVPTW